MSVTVHDNTGKVLGALDDAIEKALTRIGLAAEGYAKKELSRPKAHGDGSVRPNVDTGNLRNSITNEVRTSEKAVYIGTNVEYAAYVEMGTSRSRAYPYLKPAATEHSTTYKRIIEDELKNG